MTSPYDTYTSPLASRNASPEMLRLWSARHKFNTWRSIWLAIAEAQHEVTKDWPEAKGRPPLVTAEQVAELRAVVERGISDEEIRRAEELERDLRHDVMAHVHCLGEQCPKAKPIIHLGCTSQDVVCNADLLTLQHAISIIESKTLCVILALTDSALRWPVPTLGFTHYQPAQPLTIGRRLAQHAHDLFLGFQRLPKVGGECSLQLRGLRGATGTAASFDRLLSSRADVLAKFEAEAMFRLRRNFGLEHKASFSEMAKAMASSGGEMDSLAEALAAAVGMQVGNGHTVSFGSLGTPETYLATVTIDLVGQTYPRVIDTFILADLASIAAVLHKIATDLRLLCNRKELDEPFETNQIGSSAMPYKRNPMRCERICGLARFVMNLVGNAYDTAATQWLERTLDDSSNRRLSLPEAFLALDGALDLMHNVASGLVVHEAMVRKNLMAELPFLATENILMEAVKAGGDRQDLHERIRVHAQAAGMRVKHEGLDNDLIERLRADPAFGAVHHLLTDEHLLDPMKYIGRSVEQTERFIREVIEPLRERYKDDLARGGTSQPRV